MTKSQLFLAAHEMTRRLLEGRLGLSYQATFGMALSHLIAKSKEATMIENTTPDYEADVGREGVVKANLEYRNEVRGGGAVTPSCLIYMDYGKANFVRVARDNRSGSHRSGNMVWQLKADALYKLPGVNVSSSRGTTMWLSTFDGKTTVFGNEAAFEVEMRKRYPAGAELADLREKQARIEQEERNRREIEREQNRQLELEARREQIAEEAERIAKEGQGDTGLPTLTGSPKQIAYALKIRAAVAKRDPKNSSLKRGTTAKFWIENHRSALYA